MKRVLCSLLVLAFVMISVFPSLASEGGLELTENERAFMAEHPVIKLGIDPDFVPFEFVNEQGRYAGIAADYLSLISDRTGLQFEVVLGLPWAEAYEKVLTGEIDALPAIGKTDERAEHLLYSEPYYFFKRVIVTRDTDTEISSIDDLQGLSVAVQRNSSHHSYLLSFPQINLSLYDSAEAALTAVATNAEKAFVGNLATTNFLIRSNALTNLRYLAFEVDQEQAIHFAVRRDLPELVSIINKGLALLTDDERLAINNRWVGPSTGTDYRPLLRVLALIGSVVVLVLAVSFYWIILLRREIRMRKRTQEALEKAKQEADEANEFKSSFVARMSHELRTPLNAITGMAYLLRKTNLTTTQALYAERITQASSNMMGIVDDILDYSKIEVGKIELEMASFSLDQVIQNVASIVSYRIEEQGSSFKVAKDPQVPNWFIGDAKRIEQVLLNLLNNAAKFTAEGEISLEIGLHAREEDTYHLAMMIKDTGIGMDEEQIQKLFDPFVQGDSTINRRFGGSGLGLSIVKSLVDMMGGSIQVFSTPGQESTFIVHLSLPLDKKQQEDYTETLAEHPFRDLRTLVLEKTDTSINLIERYLRSFGMQCELTTSPAVALSMLERGQDQLGKPFDLLIIDYETPTEGGFEFIEAIRKNENIIPKPEFLMLLPMTRGDLFEELSQRDIALGIGKPIILSVLLNGICDIFRLRAVRFAQVSEAEEGTPMPLEKTYNVLVVEDNQTNQLISKSLLEQIGINVLLASNGQEGVELFRQEKENISLVLMDLHMPIMNGYDAARAIRRLPSDVPIVAMTADVIEGVKERCDENGIYHYISKPLDPAHFLQTVKDLILTYKPAKAEESNILNRTAGLRNMGDNAQLYEQVLQEYLRENQDTPNQLLSAVASERYTDARQIVHKAKSSSGSIGAEALYALSIRLQKALYDEHRQEILTITKDFAEVMTKLLREIS